MKYATRLDRFQAGDYPPVCARSGLPADKFVPVEAARRAAWPWFFFPAHLITFLVTSWRVEGDRACGRLPFATGHVEGVKATWDRRSQTVMLLGVHPDFVHACQEQQHNSA